MQKCLKPLRVVISVAMAMSVGFLFLDFSNSIPALWYRVLTWLQFVPSLTNFLTSVGHGLALTAFGFIAILLLTLLFGRVYCSYICPLGIFQDAVSWVSKRTKKKFRFRFTPPKTWLRYSVLITTALSLFTGSIILVNFLDPYSNFGRFFSDLFRPLYDLCNNLLVKILQGMGSYALYPVKVAIADPYALIIPVLMLVLVLWMSFRKGRLYCNAVCPVGTLLGLMSNISLFKIRFNKKECTQCGKCMFACKSSCIDIKQQSVDFTRCVGCANCVRVCDKNAIGYAPAPAKKMKSPDKSKRRFVIGSVLFVGALSGLSVKTVAKNLKAQNREGNVHASGDDKKAPEKTHPVAPPGAKSLHHFTATCTACHLCVSACPTGVLRPSFLEYGFFGMLQPHMDYNVSFCNYECTRCADVCPNKAILPLIESVSGEVKAEAKEKAQSDFKVQFDREPDPAVVEDARFVAENTKRYIKIRTQIGTVQFIKENCIVYADGTSCGSCSEHCPTKAVEMVAYKGELTIPQLNTAICVGCGACEYACPTIPYKAIFVDGCKEHQVAQLPEEKTPEEKPLEDFPF
ncbi:MAG: 4Fe-4S binding protein [Bacteroidales bacterium]|jgi:ferredoxin|nr:4Fe-4S binding protein [Bacteroidales bacterium]